MAEKFGKCKAQKNPLAEQLFKDLLNKESFIKFEIARILLNRIQLELEPRFYKIVNGMFYPYLRVDIVLHPDNYSNVPLEVKNSRRNLKISQVRKYADFLFSPLYLLAFSTSNAVKIILFKDKNRTEFVIPFVNYEGIKLLDSTSSSVDELIEAIKHKNL